MGVKRFENYSLTPQMIWTQRLKKISFQSVTKERVHSILKKQTGTHQIPQRKERHYILCLNQLFALLYQYVHDIVFLHEWLWPTTSRPPKAVRCEYPTPEQRIHYWQYEHSPTCCHWRLTCSVFFLFWFRITDSFLLAITSPVMFPQMQSCIDWLPRSNADSVWHIIAVFKLVTS